jgi:predicted ArsR family transcriptional regulator
MSAVNATISGAALRVVKLLVGNRPQTVAELMDSLGTTRTAVTEQLDELLAAGYVAREPQRLPGRGRPRYLYSATQAALALLFTSNARVLVPAIWDAVRESGGEKLVRDITRRVSRTMADYYSQRIKAVEPKQRLRQLIELMSQEGALVEAVEKHGHLTMRKRSCPFISMVDDHKTVCAVDLETIGLVVGRPVRRTACRHTGSPCCTFELAETNGR